MITVNAKVKINPVTKILKDHGLDDDGNVTKFLRDEVDRLSDPYVPFSENGSGAHMKNNKTYPNNHSIRYGGPYAHYHYKGELMLAPDGSAWAKYGQKKHYAGKKMKYQGSPKRGPNWDKRMMNDKSNQIIHDLQNFIKSGGVKNG